VLYLVYKIQGYYDLYPSSNINQIIKSRL